MSDSGFRGAYASTQIIPSQTSYTITTSIPFAIPGGAYHVHTERFCGEGTGGFVRLGGNELSFQVIPTKGLIFPTSATVGITESQGQILRKEALRLQSVMQDLKGRIREMGNDPILANVLANCILDRQAELQKTEEEFSHALHNDRQDKDSHVFFADIRAQYEDALGDLTRPRNRRLHPAAFSPASLELNPRPAAPGYPAIAQGTLRVLEHNELAYTTVADAESLTFDLQVESHPSDAAVSYKRHGDDFKNAPEKTTTILKSLPYAIWVVRVEAQGFRAKELEHDPFTEPNHVLHFELKP
jgi:hypothetical protein